MERGRRGEGEKEGSGGFLLISSLPSARPFLHACSVKATKKGGDGDVVQFLKKEDQRQREKRKRDSLPPSLLRSAKVERLKKGERGKRKRSAESFHSTSGWGGKRGEGRVSFQERKGEGKGRK